MVLAVPQEQTRHWALENLQFSPLGRIRLLHAAEQCEQKRREVPLRVVKLYAGPPQATYELQPTRAEAPEAKALAHGGPCAQKVQTAPPPPPIANEKRGQKKVVSLLFTYFAVI